MIYIHAFSFCLASLFFKSLRKLNC